MEHAPPEDGRDTAGSARRDPALPAGAAAGPGPARELDVVDTAYGGDGVARDGGKVVFVPGTLAGERVRARLVSDRKAFARAELLSVLTPSPDRVPPACPLALRPADDPGAPAPACPGCAYQHAAYAREVELKQRQFGDLLARLGGCDPGLADAPVPAPAPLGYRNKLVLRVQDGPDGRRLGYTAADRRTVIDLAACPLAHPALNALLARLRGTEGWLAGLPPNARVTLRFTGRDGAVHWVGAPSHRAPWLAEATPAGTLLVPRGAFFQVNPAAANLLVEAVTALLTRAAPDAVLDAYGGVGLFAFAALRAGIGRAVGIESDASAVAAARRNAGHLHLAGRVRFERGDAAAHLARASAALRPGRLAVVADPPRAGLSPAAVEALAAARPEELLYVSCAPDTLARDLKRLAAAGFAPRHARLFDLFPRTARFEALVRLQPA